MKEHLEHLARRVADDSFFLAAPLDRYARAERLDDAALATRLGCPVETLTHVRLCRNPFPEAPKFWQDIEQIAVRFGLDSESLAEIVRYGQSLLRLEATTAQLPNSCGSLMAARDSDEPSDPPAEQS